MVYKFEYGSIRPIFSTKKVWSFNFIDEKIVFSILSYSLPIIYIYIYMIIKIKKEKDIYMINVGSQAHNKKAHFNFEPEIFVWSQCVGGSILKGKE